LAGALDEELVAAEFAEAHGAAGVEAVGVVAGASKTEWRD